MARKVQSWSLALLAGMLSLGLTASVVWGEEVKVGAGAAPSENIFNRVKEPMEKAIGVKLVLISNGPYEALVDLDQGKLDAAAGGLTFADWMQMMEKKNYQIPDRNAYKYRVIGKDIVKVITHKEVGVKKLSKDDLKGIFTGKVTNWKEVGGADVPVVVVFGSKIPGTNSVFQKLAMGGESYVQMVMEAGDAPDVKDKVGKNPGAVGLAPVSLVDESVNAPEIPEVGRPITLITKGEPSAVVVKMLEFIKGEGQQYLPK